MSLTIVRVVILVAVITSLVTASLFEVAYQAKHHQTPSPVMTQFDRSSWS